MNINNHDVIDALLHVQRQQALKLYTHADRLPSQGTAMGFDFYQGTLLIDEISPSLSDSEAKTLMNRPFSIQLKHQQSLITLQCCITDYQYDLCTVKILNYSIGDNQRWFPRIHFDTRRGPKIHVALPRLPALTAHIKNLSVFGAMIEIYGTDHCQPLKTLTKTQCKIDFNELFSMDIASEIRHVSFLRSPSCHTRIRLTFAHHSAVSFAQLENFIGAFPPGDKQNLPYLAAQPAARSATKIAVY